MYDFDSDRKNELTYEQQLLESNKKVKFHLLQLIPKSILFTKDFLYDDFANSEMEENVDAMSLANLSICVNARLFPEEKAVSVKIAILIKLIIHEMAHLKIS